VSKIFGHEKTKTHARVIFHACAGTSPLRRLLWILAWG